MSDIIQDYDVKMNKTIEVIKGDFAAVRAGRADAGVLNKITVEYYGTDTPLQQVAGVSTPDPPDPGDPALGRVPPQGH